VVASESSRIEENTEILSKVSWSVVVVPTSAMHSQCNCSVAPGIAKGDSCQKTMQHVEGSKM